MNIFAPFIGRFIAIFVAWAATHLAVRYGIVVDSAAQGALVDNIVNVVSVLLGIYATSHKIADKYFNAGDTASSHLVASRNLEARQIKASEDRIAARRL